MTAIIPLITVGHVTVYARSIGDDAVKKGYRALIALTITAAVSSMALMLTSVQLKTFLPYAAAFVLWCCGLLITSLGLPSSTI